MNTSVIDQQAVSPVAPKVRAPKAPKATRSIKASVLAPSRPKRIADLVKGRGVELEGLTKGADPECMIVDIDSGQIVSSIPILKRDKNNPIALASGGKLYADIVLVECSFPASETNHQMIETMRQTFIEMQEVLGRRYRLLPQASHEFDPADLIEQYGVDPMKIACEESFLAWSLDVKDGGAFTSGLRTGSFHIHLGHENLMDARNRIKAIKLMDLYVGLSSILFDVDPTSPARRALYGVSGEHRLPPWGAEYRVLSPFALRSPALVELVLDLTDHSLKPLIDGTADDVIRSIKPEEVQLAINTCDAPLAEKILVSIGLPHALMKRVKQDRGALDMQTEWKLPVLTA